MVIDAEPATAEKWFVASVGASTLKDIENMAPRIKTALKNCPEFIG